MLSVINAGWFGILVGLIGGVAISFYFFQKGKAKISIAVEMNHSVIIAPDRPDDKLEVRYGGKVVPRVTRTMIGLWNNGNQTIRRGDISPREQLRITAHDLAEILRVTVISRTREVTGSGNTYASAKEALLDFDFLNPADGFSVEIIHTGKSYEIKVSGVIQGMRRNVGEPAPPSRIGPIVGYSIIGFAILTSAVMGIAVFGLILFVAYNRPFPFNVLLAAGAVGMAYIMWSSRKIEHGTQKYRIPGVPEAISDSLASNIPWLHAQPSEPTDSAR